MSQTATVTATEVQETNPYEKYQWRKDPNGLWQRDVDEAERFYASMCRKANDPEAAAFAITGTVTFSVKSRDGTNTSILSSKVEESLRAAWKVVRRQCPAVASWIAYDKPTDSWKRFCSSFENSPDPAAAEDEWLSSTFRTIETDMTEEEWFNTDPSVPKLPTLFLIQPNHEDTSIEQYQANVCFRSPHDVIDGHGILQLLDLLFEVAADTYNGTPKMNVGSGTGELSAPFRVACDVAPTPSASQMKHFKDTFINNASVATGAPLLGLPTDITPGAASKRKRVATSLSKSSSAKLLARCKEEGLTVTHAISAAVVLALRELQPEDKAGMTLRWYMQGLLSLRYLCQPPYNTPQHAAGNFHMIATQGLGLDVEVSGKAKQEKDGSSSEFLHMASKVKDYYIAVRPPGDRSNRDDLDVAAVTWKAVTPSSSAEQPAKSTEEAYAPASIAVSSLGNISAMVRAEREPFKLSNVWVAGEGQGSATPLMLGGYGGRVEVSAIFDNAFYSEEYMKGFQRAVLTAAVEGLGIAE